MQRGFVWLDEAVPGILWDAKYATSDNFTGAPGKLARVAYFASQRMPGPAAASQTNPLCRV